MKLARFGEFRQEKPCIVLDNGIRKDCSGYFEDWDSDFFANGKLDALHELDMDDLPDVPENARWGSCVPRPGKLVCIGLNYRDHAEETGAEIPQEPIIFMKGTNTVVGPFDNIIIPRGSKKTDWEVELAIVIGKEARYLASEADSAACIAGFSISNDLSEREFQIERCGQWTKGKSCDNFCPVGPYLLTKDEIEDVCDLKMALSVNGEPRQKGNTSNMIFKPLYLVWYLSQYMTLEPGDIISTGTPPGVGMGMNPPVFLKAGDVVTLSIEGFGKQEQTCVDA